MKKYCFTCGSKLEFSPRDKPKFCMKCGNPLESSAGRTSPPQRRVDEDDSDFDDEENVGVPTNITELNFEFQDDSLGQKSETIGSLMGTLNKDQIGKFSWDSPKITKKEARKQFKKEAGSIRPATKKKDAQK